MMTGACLSGCHLERRVFPDRPEIRAAQVLRVYDVVGSEVAFAHRPQGHLIERQDNVEVALRVGEPDEVFSLSRRKPIDGACADRNATARELAVAPEAHRAGRVLVCEVATAARAAVEHPRSGGIERV